MLVLGMMKAARESERRSRVWFHTEFSSETEGEDEWLHVDHGRIP